ncbi:hypothetical protein KJ032_26370, partial [Salmonella enterica subsp. enterica serovar Typhimurium]|nr:hypothetical protein [Salmonella enterica subsp. enterica serovar Typhimurium]
MVIHSLDIKKDPLCPKEDDELVLGPEVPYLSAICALLYLAQCTRPDIAFSVNLLARYSSTPTIRHWKGVKDVLRYLRGTTDMSLFYSEKSTNDQVLIGYADAGEQICQIFIRTDLSDFNNFSLLKLMCIEKLWKYVFS